MNRLLAPTEHLMWLSYQNRPENVILCAEVTGELSVNQLTEVLEWLQRRHSRLNIRIVTDQNNQPRFISQDVPPIPLRVLNRQGDDHWHQVAEEELLCPLPENTGPLLRVLLLESSEISNLIVTFHHAIGDGLSGVYLMRDILQGVGEPDSDRQLLPDLPPIDRLIPQITEDSLEQNPNSQTKTELGENLSPIANTNDDLSDSPPRLLYWTISPQETTQLVNKCREEQTTVYGALCAAFLLGIAAERNVSQETALKCHSPMNLRQYLNPPIGENFGEYIARPTISYRLSKNSRFWDLARSVKQELDRVVTEGKLFEDVLAAKTLLSKSFDRGERSIDFRDKLETDIAITNLGRLNIPDRFGSLELQELYLTVTGTKKLPIGIGVATVKNKMCFTFRYLEYLLSDGNAENLKTVAMQILLGA